MYLTLFRSAALFLVPTADVSYWLKYTAKQPRKSGSSLIIRDASHMKSVSKMTPKQYRVDFKFSSEHGQNSHDVQSYI